MSLKKVRCIDAGDSTGHLRVGQEYDVTEEIKYYYIINMGGTRVTFLKSRFVDVTPSAPQAIEASNSPLRQDAPNQGVKGDAGKPDLSLMSTIWIFGVGDTLTYGKKKRGANNWRKGLPITRLMSGALRHIFQFLNGEDYDFDPTCEGCIAHKAGGDECVKHSGKHHLYCASCNLMFASELLVTRPDLDDRYKGEPKKSEEAV